MRSRQVGPHPRLRYCVLRHLGSHWLAPPHRPTAEVFARLEDLLADGETQRLVLDSGCGTGASTRRLAERFPNHLVIGVDKSAARLTRTGYAEFPQREGNCIWVRGDLPTFWRQALAAGWRVRRHYLLYPNPWPKAGHLKRRWHAHPVFPVVLGLGGVIEMRCNWAVYAAEFAQAAGLATGREVTAQPLRVTDPLSPFEAKYRGRGHALYAVRFQAAKKGPRSPGPHNCY